MRTCCSGSGTDRAAARPLTASSGSPGRRWPPTIAAMRRRGSLGEAQRWLEKGKPSEADDWFRRATAPGAPTEVVRGAFLGLGDVKLAQGDVAAALESYQQALAGGTPGDTITQRAQEKINALGKADAPPPPNQP